MPFPTPGGLRGQAWHGPGPFPFDSAVRILSNTPPSTGWVYVYSGATGKANGLTWKDAYTTLTAALAAASAGAYVAVAHDHAESTAGVVTLLGAGTLASPVLIFCVLRSANVPRSRDLRTTATVTSTGANGISLTGNYLVYGVTFSAGSGAVSATNLFMGVTTNTWERFDNCKFITPTTANSPASFVGIGAGVAGRCCYVEMNGCTFKFGTTSQYVNPNGAIFVWRNSTAIDPAGSVPTTFFSQAGNTSSPYMSIFGEGIDFSSETGTLFGAFTAGGQATLKDCKLNASTTVIAASSVGGPIGLNVEIIRCDSGTTNYRTERHWYMGDQTTETTIVRTGGASDGSTQISNKIITTANSKWFMSFETLPLIAFNNVASGNVTVTVEGTWNVPTPPNNDDIWIEVEYLGASSSPLGSFSSLSKSDGLADPAVLPASVSAWGGGGSGAGWSPFTMSVTFAPLQIGAIVVRVRCAKPSATFYVDPVPVLS